MNFLKAFLVSFFLIASLGCKEAPSIAIFAWKCEGVTPWDPDSVKKGITGSEEAVIYMSEKLAKLGYNVRVYGYPPAGSTHSSANANPRFIDIDNDDKSVVDIAISWRLPTASRELKKRAKRVYLWPHDTCNWKLTNEAIQGFDDVLWLSRYQSEQWMSENSGFSRFIHVFGNGLNPEQFLPIVERDNPYSCIYSSNYGRGLELLLDIWPIVKRKFPRATLDIYYGWNTWGLLSREKEIYMRGFIDIYSVLGVREHGLVGHEELTRAFEKASLWAYPCIAPETFCITALRAQMAGCVPVVIKTCALRETVQAGFSCAAPKEYLDTLLKAMHDAEQISLDERKSMGDFILQKYTWDEIAASWDMLFKSHTQ